MMKRPLPPGDPKTATWNSSRRRLLLAGLASAPFLVSLAARPARATEAMGSLGAYDYHGDRPGGELTDPTQPMDPTLPRPGDERPGSLQERPGGGLG